MLKTIVLTVLCAIGLSAQTPNYTQSVSHACNVSNEIVCLNLPVDQGGTWGFIVCGEFELVSGAVTLQGGNICSSWTDTMPEPKLPGVGGQGTFSFTFTANNPDHSLHYVGHVTGIGHEVRRCVHTGCWDQTVVDSAEIFIDSVS
jgi:hypothetical protein